MIDALTSPQLNDVRQRALHPVRTSGIVVLRFHDLVGGELFEQALRPQVRFAFS